jgi:ribulose-phosphate 3-epimerase
MHSHFVPNITFGHPVLEWVKKGNPDIFMDCHMMVSDPLRVSPPEEFVYGKAVAERDSSPDCL